MNLNSLPSDVPVLELSTGDMFVYLRQKYRKLYAAVEGNHQAVVLSGKSTIGHGFDHALMVAQYAAMFSESGREAEMAWVAALMHNTDRHHEPTVASQVIDGYVSLVVSEFTPDEVLVIRNAVANHSKKNDAGDSMVLRALKDGDRTANCGPVNLFRCALHNHDKPAFLLEELSVEGPSTGSTFKAPRSCFDALFFNEEWRLWLRMPKAIKMAQKHFDYLRQHQLAILEQLREVGLYPWIKA
jgi:hypothetical protein